MGFDWNYLFDLKVDELSDENVESLYDQLIQFDPKDEDNVQRLRKLLEVSQSIMQIKSVQAEVAIDEMKEMNKKFDSDELDKLRKELDIFKKSDSKGENIAMKLSEANDVIIELKNTIESKESENIKLKRKLNDLQNTMEFREKEVMALRSELDSLRDETDNQRQVSDDSPEKQEILEKLREKNQQIQTLLDELRDGEIVNLELTNQCKKLKLELKSATNELQISCNQMEMLSKQINELKQLNEDFLSEKKYLMEEIDKLKQTLNKYENGDHNILDEYVDNLKDLQNLVRLKDEEIIKLKTSSLIPKEEIKEMQKRMSKEIEEKDKQIDLLKSQLNEAVVDMENQTEIIRKLYQQNRGDDEVSKLNHKIDSLSNQLKTIEEEVLAKDDEILDLRKRINIYERGEYGLKDALKEINDLTKHLNNRDQRIEEMVQQLNQLKLDLDDAEDAIDGTKQDKPSEQQIEKQTIPTEERKSNKRDKIKILEMERRILELEDQKFALSERLKLSLNKSVVDKYQEYKEINELNERLKSVETENSELQLGIKEILNAIRETDSQSDVIIECPTLERLCKQLEGRTIGNDLANVIALKAELDLVRGHNEQLRTDMRSMRSDYLKVIAQYTQDLLENDVFDEPVYHNSEQNDSLKVHNLVNILDKKENKLENNEYIPSVEKTNDKNEIIQKEDQLSVSAVVLPKVSVETQTIPIIEPIIESKESIDEKIIERTNAFTQTETTSETLVETEKQSFSETLTKSPPKCENCPKVMKIVNFLKECVEKLEQNIKSSETKYLQRLELLQNENKKLDLKFNEKERQVNQMEKEINDLKNKSNSAELIATPSDDTSNRDDYKSVTTYSAQNRNQFQMESKTELSSSCKTVLESVINCLQARLEHKEESIRQYRSMLSEAKQNFENEMIRLLESIRENDRKNSINFKQMIDNEELESALKSCVNELELCKTELNSRISHLENELEIKTTKLMAYQTENEELRHKRMTPTAQLKQTVEELREELKQKDSVISSLSKTIKDDRSMRAFSGVRRPKDELGGREKKVDNELFQEIANLRATIETQKKTISSLEIVKWDLEKNLKDLKQQIKIKLKDKDNEINELKEKVIKIREKLNKNENEKHVLQSKILKRETTLKNCQNKSTQISPQTNEYDLIKLKNELKKSQKDVKQKESEANVLRTDLELSRQIESELKTLLRESVKREKLATIHEESTQIDQHMEQLLQENAQIKVELRMAEFELRKRSTI